MSQIASNAGPGEEVAAAEAQVFERKTGILIHIPPARVPYIVWTSVAGILVFGALAVVFVFVLAEELNLASALAIGLFHIVMIGCAWTFAVTMWRRETVAVDDRTIVIERRLLGLHIRHELVIVPEARLWLDDEYSETPLSTGEDRYPTAPITLNRGPIVYQGAKGRRICFGSGLSVSEAENLVERIHAKSPSLIN